MVVIMPAPQGTSREWSEIIQKAYKEVEAWKKVNHVKKGKDDIPELINKVHETQEKYGIKNNTLMKIMGLFNKSLIELQEIENIEEETETI